MTKKRKKRNTRFTSKRFFILAISLVLITFLALPLIFSDSTESKEQDFTGPAKALPLKTENPFTRYLKLLKNFYSSGKKINGKKDFTKTNNSLLAKNTTEIYKEELPPTLSPQATAVSSLHKGEDAPTNNYYAAETAENPFYNLMQEPQNPFVEQKPFDNILIEGLYETSHTDPYEVKQAARRTLFDIFSPRRRRLSLLSPSVSSAPLLTMNNVQNSLQGNISSSNPTDLGTYSSNAINYNSSGARRTYNYGGLSSFTTNKAYGNIDISGLSFEDQANLIAAKLNTINQTNNESRQSSQSSYSSSSSANNNGKNNNPQKPLPKNTFDPNAWNQEVLKGGCHTSNTNTESENQEANANQQDPNKILFCDPELIDRLNRVNKKMQEDYKYIFVSGRYEGQIMIPAHNSLSDNVRTAITYTGIAAGIDNIELPEEIKNDKNTQETNFEFVRSIKPQLFEQLMKNENIILISTDPMDMIMHPLNTIHIDSGAIETYSGANKLIGQINDFKAQQEKVRKFLKQKEEKEKKEKLQDLGNKIESNLEKCLPKNISPQKKDEFKTLFYSKMALAMHEYCKGKITSFPKANLWGTAWMNIWYTPGVGAPTLAIKRNEVLIHVIAWVNLGNKLKRKNASHKQPHII